MAKVQRSSSSLLTQWDKGSRAKRLDILVRFVHTHRDATGAEIEKHLGAISMLLFTRITAWLRLTYQLGYELSTQLNAIALFLQGQRFLTNFLEIGGVQTLCDLLCVKNVKPVDKQNALLILIHIANSGRVYREMICDAAGIDLLVQSWLPEQNEETLELYGTLFMALGQGNPRKSSLVHAGLVYTIHQGTESAALTAATTLRSLQLAKQYYAVNKSSATSFPSITNQHANRQVRSAGGGKPKVNVTALQGVMRTNTITPPTNNVQEGREITPTDNTTTGEEQAGTMLLDALFHLLESSNIKLRFEGTSLIVIASQNQQLLPPIVNRMLDVLEDDSFLQHHDEEEIGWSMTGQQRQQAACARALANIIVQPTPAVGSAKQPDLFENSTFTQNKTTSSQWSVPARADVARILDKRCGHLTILRLLQIADPKDIDTQRECLTVLQVIANAESHFTHMKTALEEAFGDTYDTLRFTKEFDLDVVKELRQQVMNA